MENAKKTNNDCLGKNMNEDLKDKIVLDKLCDCLFCKDVRMRKSERDIDEYI